MGESTIERNDCIVKWKTQHAFELETRARERMAKEWISTSNYWDPIRDMNEAFEIVDIRVVDIRELRNWTERDIILHNIS